MSEEQAPRPMPRLARIVRDGQGREVELAETLHRCWMALQEEGHPDEGCPGCPLCEVAQEIERRFGE